MIKLLIIITEGDFLSQSEQNRKQIKIVTLSELNRRAEDTDKFIATSEKSPTIKLSATPHKITKLISATKIYSAL